MPLNNSNDLFYNWNNSNSFKAASRNAWGEMRNGTAFQQVDSLCVFNEEFYWLQDGERINL